jgi:hypothetical protein
MCRSYGAKMHDRIMEPTVKTVGYVMPSLRDVSN